MSTTLTISPSSITELDSLAIARVVVEPESSSGSRNEQKAFQKKSDSNCLHSGRNQFPEYNGSGILTVALPTMARNVGLSAELLLWYVTCANYV